MAGRAAMNRPSGITKRTNMKLTYGEQRNCAICNAAFTVTRRHRVGRCCSRACQTRYSSERFNGMSFEARQRQRERRQGKP
jgi:hypothetical protein